MNDTLSVSRAGTPGGHDRPLIVFTVCGPASAGLVLGAAILFAGGLYRSFLTTALVASLGLGLIGLGASVLHLERPLRAYRALKAFPHSPLSREIVLFAVYLAGLAAAAVAVAAGAPGWVSWIVASLGLAAVYASARIYLLPARPQWNRRATVVRFLAGGTALGGSASLTLALFWPKAEAPVATALLSLLVLGSLAASSLAARAATSRGTLALRGEHEGAHPGDVYRHWRLGAGTLVPVVALAFTPLYAEAVVITLLGATAGEVADRWLFFHSAAAAPTIPTRRTGAAGYSTATSAREAPR